MVPSLAAIKRHRQWSEQKVSAWPSGQTFTPRLLIMMSFVPSPLSLLSESPRSFAVPLVQSRKTSTPTKSFFALTVEDEETFDIDIGADVVSSAGLYFAALRVWGVWPIR
jgi:hypothetical protein